MTPRFLTAITLASTFLVACNSGSSTTTPATVTQLSVGNPNCPSGGVSISSGGTTAYACSGESGQTGVKGDQGIQGPQGDPGSPGLPGVPGGGYYTKRDDMYCRFANASTSAQDHFGVAASCDQIADLPVFGDCHQEDSTAALLTGVSKTDGWTANQPTTAATVNCMWKNAGNSALFTNAQLPSAFAEICCITHP